MQAQLADAQTMPAGAAAYRFGRAVAAQSVLVGAAHGKTPAFGWCHAIARATQAVFPLTAADLVPELTGAALGRALRHAEAAWIDSDFTLTRAELLDLIRKPETQTAGPDDHA